MYGITFNGKHSYKDMGFTLTTEKEITEPAKEKIVVRVPYSNQRYDFSGIYGSQIYTDRTLTYGFNVLNKYYGNTKEKMNFMRTELVNWLMDSNGRKRLYDDAIPGYYFLAEVEEETSLQENWDTGILTVTFTAYPFKIKDAKEGSPYWDDYSILDTYQETEFKVNGSLPITLLNDGKSDIKPKIITDAPFEITMGNKIYNITSGITESYDFMLKKGSSNLVLKGTGNIQFLFYKELI